MEESIDFILSSSFSRFAVCSLSIKVLQRVGRYRPSRVPADLVVWRTLALWWSQGLVLLGASWSWEADIWSSSHRSSLIRSSPSRWALPIWCKALFSFSWRDGPVSPFPVPSLQTLGEGEGSLKVTLRGDFKNFFHCYNVMSTNDSGVDIMFQVKV